MTAICLQSSKCRLLFTLMWVNVFVGALLLGACSKAPETDNKVFSFSGSTMGTVYAVKIVTAGRVDIARLEEAGLQQTVSRELEKLNRIFSTYDPTSELSRLNSKQTLQALPISAQLASVLNVAQDVSRLSNGAFDVTIGPLVNLWGFGPNLRPNFEEIEAQLSTVMPLVGNQHYRINAGSSQIEKSKPGLSLDLSGLAKGYAVDVIFELLQQQGSRHLMVEIGGEVRAAGRKPNGEPWQIGIEKPVAGRRVIAWQLALVDRAMASSGDYRNFVDHEGSRYSHLIDPRTGWPVKFRNINVTVLHRQTMYADAWATALTILGQKQGLKVAEQNDIAVQYQVGEEVFRSSAFDSLTLRPYPP